MTSREIIRMLKKDGWRHVATSGDHFQFKHPVKPGKVTVPHPNREIEGELLKSIERQSGLKLKRRG